MEVADAASKIVRFADEHTATSDEASHTPGNRHGVDRAPVLEDNAASVSAEVALKVHVEIVVAPGNRCAVVHEQGHRSARHGNRVVPALKSVVVPEKHRSCVRDREREDVAKFLATASWDGRVVVDKAHQSAPVRRGGPGRPKRSVRQLRGEDNPLAVESRRRRIHPEGDAGQSWNGSDEGYDDRREGRCPCGHSRRRKSDHRGQYEKPARESCHGEPFPRRNARHSLVDGTTQPLPRAAPIRGSERRPITREGRGLETSNAKPR